LRKRRWFPPDILDFNLNVDVDCWVGCGIERFTQISNSDTRSITPPAHDQGKKANNATSSEEDAPRIRQE